MHVGDFIVEIDDELVLEELIDLLSASTDAQVWIALDERNHQVGG